VTTEKLTEIKTITGLTGITDAKEANLTAALILNLSAADMKKLLDILYPAGVPGVMFPISAMLSSITE